MWKIIFFFVCQAKLSEYYLHSNSDGSDNDGVDGHTSKYINNIKDNEYKYKLK